MRFAPCLALLLAGCGLNSVSIAYPRPADPAALARTRALGNLYLQIRKPALPQDDILGRGLRQAAAGSRLLGRALFPVDAGHFAAELAAQLEGRGASVLAYRVLRGEGEDSFLSRLEPAGVLSVSFESLDIDRQEFEKKVKTTVTRRDKDGREVKEEQERTQKAWRFKAALTLKARLWVRESGEVLAEFEQVVRHEKEESAGSAPPSSWDWYQKAQHAVLSQAARELPRRVASVPVLSRRRTLFTDKEDPASRAARDAAGRGDWERASELWAERLEAGRGGWRELMNLAAAAEKRREFAEAERLYRKAREAAGADPEAAKAPFDEIFADLTQGLEAVGSRSAASVRWFDAPLAVMPFSDETTSVDGPLRLRELAAQALAKAGYQVLPPEEVDRALRDHGLSQGGQLRFKDTPKYSEWLGGARLIYGHLTHFDEIMLGLYHKRVVAGRMTLWDPGPAETVWRADEAALREALHADPREAGVRFGAQLFGALFERIVDKPLGPESALFIRQNLETLPLRPVK